MLQSLQIWSNFVVLSYTANIAETLRMLQMLQSFRKIITNVADPTIDYKCCRVLKRLPNVNYDNETIHSQLIVFFGAFFTKMVMTTLVL